jgi:NSS family neurotransmitter:Na+ symporter
MKDRGIKRSQWKSQAGFIIASVGAAIGVGNIWRFSYMAYENGGGAFLLPYLIALFTTGIPLLILEFGIGHERIGSAPLAYHKINKNWEWLGWWTVIFVMFGILLYYVVILAWCLNFFFFSFNIAWGQTPDDFFFKKFLMLSPSPFEVGSIRIPILSAALVIWCVNWFIVYKGVDRGIEKANKIFMPLLFILTVIMVLWSLTLEGSGNGLKAYFLPDFSKITHSKVWIDAFSQIFFSLGLGFGIMIAYASYMPHHCDITKSAWWTAIINSCYSIFAGIATFSILGYMAGQQNKEISEVVSQSIGLAFVAYPKAISLMPGGPIFGAIFFLCLVVAGLSSSISLTEAFISSFIDKFGFKRKKLIIGVTVMGCVGSLIFTTQGGLFWLDIVDHFLTHYGLVVVGILECFLVGWIFNISRLQSHINSISRIKVGRWWNFFIKFFVPFILSITLATDLYRELKEPYGGYPQDSSIAIGVLWIGITLTAAFVMVFRPWKTEKHKEKGRAL